MKRLRTELQEAKSAARRAADEEERFRRLETEFRVIFDAVPAMIWFKDTENRIIKANRLAAETRGVRVEDMEGRHTAEFYPQEAEKYHADDLEVIRSGRPKVGLIELNLTGTGEKRWVRADKFPYRDPDGNIIGVIAFAMDITETKAALEEREHSISLLRATIESTADGILVVDRTGKVRLLNQRFLDMWGIPPGIAAARDDDRMVTFVLDQLRDPGAFLARIRELYAKPEEETIDVLEFRDGRTFERYSRPQRLDHRVIGRVWSFRNVTQQRRGARELSEHAATQAFLARASSELTAALGFEKTVRSVARLAVPRLADWCVVDFAQDGSNMRRVACAHRDEHKTQVVAQLPQSCLADPATGENNRGKPARELHVGRVPEHAGIGAVARRPECAALLEQVGIRAFMRVPLVARDQVLGELVAVRTEPGANWSERERAVALEFGYRAALAVDNARLYETAVEANQAKSDFLAVMSHELRTPLNAIVGYANLMQAGIPVPLAAPQRQQLERILASTRHLTELIENVLALSRLEAGREEVLSQQTDLTELAREVAALIDPAFTEKNLQLRLELPGEPLVIASDPGKIRQILLNLLSNAAKFTERGHVELALRSEPSRAVITVSDTGIGIAADDLDRIFEAFTQVTHGAARTHGGTGLGLSVSRHLARVLGGDLTAESEPGKGSRFELVLPRG